MAAKVQQNIQLLHACVLLLLLFMRVHTNLNALPSFRHTVVTIGSFDGVHTGHVHILKQMVAMAKQLGLESVAVTFDPHPRTVLRQPDANFSLLTSTDEKIALLAQTGLDHAVFVPFTLEFAQLSAQAYVEDFLLQQFQPAVLVIGYDHRFGHDRVGDLNFLVPYSQQYGFELHEIPVQMVDEMAVSSTKIRKALAQCDINTANKLLGYAYLLSGKVVYGDQIGRTIGFPTANLQLPDPHKLIPPNGIYAAKAQLANGQIHAAMLYIGDRPTVDGNSERRIEVNLLRFSGDLYGQTLTVEVIDHIRGDKKLPDLPALQAQIAADQVAIEARLAQEQPAETVAIVILNYNTRQHLLEYLPSVIQHSAGARIVVADNGSPDDSMAMLREQFPQVEVLDLVQNWGFAEGYNRALAQVEADYYVILNSDVLVTPNWLAPVLEAMQNNPNIAVAQPKILAEKRRERFEHAGAAGGWIDALGYPFCRGRIFTHVEADNGQYDDAAECFWAAGAAFFVRADLFHRFGGFDGDFFAHNEEIDLCWRLKRAGYSVWCFPESVVYHLGGGTLDYDNPRKAYLNFRNSLFSIVKNARRERFIWLIPARLLLDGVAALMYLSKGQWQHIRAIWDAHQSFFGSWSLMMRKRREIAALLKRESIGPPNRNGVYHASIVFNHYIRRIKEFSRLRT
jgi:riboflavin kinase/FMN adenylyltransferase